MSRSNGKHPANGKVVRKPRLYSGYTFRGQDPMVKEVLAVIADHPLSKICGKDNIARGTIAGWKGHKRKKTMRPQHATMAAALGSAGKRFVITDK